jgi:hypothetical protein
VNVINTTSNRMTAKLLWNYNNLNFFILLF